MELSQPTQPVIDAVYFLHVSFLEEVSEAWLDKQIIGASANLFRGIFMATAKPEFQMITCDRTYSACKKNTKYELVAIPAFYSLLNYKALPQDDEDSDTEDDIIYALKVASLNMITGKHAFFVVSDAKKAEIQAKATKAGYTNRILSTSDFVL